MTEAVAVRDAADRRGGRAADRPTRSRSSSTPSGSPTRPTSAASRLGLRGDDAVYGAAARACSRRAGATASTVRGLLVEPMAAAGLELIVGLRRDPQFGPAVLVGLGGILTEVLDDVAIRLAPLDAASGRRDARRPARGAPPATGSAAGRRSTGRPSWRCSSRSASSALERPDVLEVDLNPVIATADGAIAVDALVVLEGPPR